MAQAAGRRHACRERAAAEALLDRTMLPVSPEAYTEFLARLDAPPQPNDKLRRAMQTPAPWDRS